MGYIICTQKEFGDLNKKALEYVKEKFDAKANVWSKEKIHPLDGRIAFTVKDRMLDILSPQEKDSIVELTDDWFPKEEL